MWTAASLSLLKNSAESSVGPEKEFGWPGNSLTLIFTLSERFWDLLILAASCWDGAACSGRTRGGSFSNPALHGPEQALQGTEMDPVQSETWWTPDSDLLIEYQSLNKIKRMLLKFSRLPDNIWYQWNLRSDENGNLLWTSEPLWQISVSAPFPH